MPLGECNGHYECDSCKRPLKKGTEAWIDIEENEIHCLPCHNGEPPPADPSGPKTDDLKKDVATLKRRIKELERSNNRLRTNGKELLAILKDMRGKGKKEDLTLTEERLRLRKR